MISPSAQENYDRLQLHLSNLGRARSFTPDRFIFKVVFDGGCKRAGFKSASHFAPLAYPAFVAGDPSARIGFEAEVTHVGGEISDRDHSPYISTSRDLLWCLWVSARQILVGKVRPVVETQIYVIADGDEYNDIQTNIYCPEYWDNVKNIKIDTDIRELVRRTRKFGIPASEVLVHKKVSRDRIVGVLTLDREILILAGLHRIVGLRLEGDVLIPAEMDGICYNYRRALNAITEYGWQEDIAALSEWCEEHVRPLKCIGKSQFCFIRGLFNALFFKLKDDLLRLVDYSERDSLEEHLEESFYLPWLEYLECHECDHGESLTRSNFDHTQRASADVVPIPVFSEWTILNFGLYSFF